MTISKPRVLLQLDTDKHPSSFDAIVAADAGVDHLLAYSHVLPKEVTSLVHGAMFTRSPDNLRSTAIFIGGSDVTAAEALLEAAQVCFFGPVRVSILLDPSGANTTAAAAVQTIANHIPLANATITVLAATGPVGKRAVRLLAQEGSNIRVASRSLDKAAAVCEEVRERSPEAKVTPIAPDNDAALADALIGCDAVLAAGAAGVSLLPASVAEASPVRVAIDLNAVPPAGIEGIGPMDAGCLYGNCHCYGAIGVGGLKMKIHQAALEAIFRRNDAILDAEEIFSIAKNFNAV